LDGAKHFCALLLKIHELLRGLVADDKAVSLAVAYMALETSEIGVPGEFDHLSDENCRS
jgi:hypothetical protein